MKGYLEKKKNKKKPMTQVEKMFRRIRHQALNLQVATLQIISSVGFIVPSNTKNKEWKKPKYKYTKMRSASTTDIAVKYFFLTKLCLFILKQIE